MDCLIIGNLTEAADAEILLDWPEIIVKQFLENAEIILYQCIDASLARTDLLTGHAERILAHHKEKCQVIVPQIIIKPVIGCHLKDTLYLHIDISDETSLIVFACLVFSEDFSHLVEDAVLIQVSIHQ